MKDTLKKVYGHNFANKQMISICLILTFRTDIRGLCWCYVAVFEDDYFEDDFMQVLGFLLKFEDFLILGWIKKFGNFKKFTKLKKIKKF
jgi:hypothetical protein